MSDKADDRFDLLPQSPRPTGEMTQLSPEGLGRLFDDNIPIPPQLSQEAARTALAMHQVGSDVVAIAGQVRTAPSVVRAFLERIDQAKAAQRAKKSAAAVVISSPAESAPPEDAAADAAPELTAPAPAEPRKAPRDTRPDVELTTLQKAVARRLRAVHVPAAAIAKALRISVDQVQRLCGEAP